MANPPPSSSFPSLSIPTALIVVDLQQEFFSPDGMFKKKHLLSDSLLLSLTPFLSLFRSVPNSLVVWIRSVYLNNTPPFVIPPSYSHSQKLHSLLHRTHTGRPCCAPSSPLLSFISEIEPHILPHDLIVTKNNYSAFNNTDLAEQLEKKGIERVIITGVTATTCVFATAMQAKQQKFIKEVIVVEDCVGYSSEHFAKLAFSELKTLGIDVIHSSDLQLQ